MRVAITDCRCAGYIPIRGVPNTLKVAGNRSRDNHRARAANCESLPGRHLTHRPGGTVGVIRRAASTSRRHFQIVYAMLTQPETIAKM